MKRFAMMALVASLALGSAPASANFTTLFAFGDSLSDAGNLYLATGQPAPPYVGGHFSNGPTWVEDLSLDLGLGTLAPSLLGGNDFAYGGAQTGVNLVNPSARPIDLPAQISAYEAVHSSPVPGALYTLDIGANDILNGLSSSNPALVVEEAIGNTLSQITELFSKDGARNLLFYDVPQLGLTPDLNTEPESDRKAADELAQAFNAGVLDGLEPLEKDGLKVYNLNTYGLLGEIVGHPTEYGFTNVTDACIDDPSCAGGSVSVQNQNLFWDGVHPTAAGHLLTAGFAYDVLNGIPFLVPEPSTWAMMLAGFVFLGFAGYRASRKSAAF
jgi:phospholipase/lecithinase/hemolysin